MPPPLNFFLQQGVVLGNSLKFCPEICDIRKILIDIDGPDIRRCCGGVGGSWRDVVVATIECKETRVSAAFPS